MTLSCNKVEFSSKGGTSFISGIVSPLVGSIAHVESSPVLFPVAYAAVCTDPVYARIYSIDNDGTLAATPLATQTLNSTAIYKFDSASLGINLSSKIQYLVEVSGCTSSTPPLSRPVTEISENQDIDNVTTLVGLTTNAVPTKKINESTRDEIKELLNDLKSANASSVNAVYQNVQASPTLQQKYTNTFVSTPTALLNSVPKILTESVASIYNENLAVQLSAHAIHWKIGYTLVYKWELDGTEQHTGYQWSFYPEANDQGTHTITLYIGKSAGDLDTDGDLDIDTSLPYLTKTYIINVLNTSPATAPTLSIAASNVISRNITLAMDTGLAFVNCDSLTNLALTEDTTLAPSNPASYNITCDDAVSQAVNYTLTSAGDGVKTLRLWARDASGTVSAVANTLAVTLDTTFPSASLSDVASALRGGQTFNEILSGSDTVALASLNLYYAQDGTTFSLVTSSLTASSSSYNWTVPFHNTSSAKLRLIATDNSGNVTTATTAAFTIDSNAPTAPSVTLASTTPTNSSSITLTVASCADRDFIFVNESTVPSILASGWVACSTTAAATTYTLLGSTQGARSVNVWARDSVGNVSASTAVGLSLDTVAPSAPGIIFSSNLALAEKKATPATALTVSSCAETAKILVSTNSSAPLPDDINWQNCVTTTGGILYTLSPLIQDTHALKAWSKDTVGNISTSTVLSFLYDTAAPLANTMNVNNGQTLTGNNNLLINLTSSSSRQDITSFCIKYNNITAPLSSDTCWVTLTSIGYTVTNNFTLTNYPFQIGTILDDYDLRIWYKDDLNNISTQTDTLNVDKYTISYQPDPPPSISNAIASSSDTPSTPLSSADTTVTIGADVYVRWNITDNNAIPAGNISLYYTTNDSTYTLINGSLSNGPNGICTVDGASTGCYKWTAASPLSSYYKIKVAVTDSGISSIFSLTNALNTGNINFLSGNTSLGFGGSANSAILIGEGEANFNDAHDNGALAVTNTGHIFYKYKGVGLVHVSPETGLLQTLIPQTGTYSGNGVSVSSASLRSLTRITLDHQGNVILWDYDLIRKINLSVNPWRIDTIIGGGADVSDGAQALSTSIGTTNNTNMFTTFPNGRIYYQRGKEIWYFDPTDSKVKKHLSLGGLGTSTMTGANAVYDNDTCPMTFTSLGFNKVSSAFTKIIRKGGMNTNAECGALAPGAYTGGQNTSFNPSTGLAESPHPPSMDWTTTSFTGLDGKIYLLMQGRGLLKRYNPTTNIYENVVGSGAIGRCIDGTPATSCPVIIMSAFVNEFGKIFFFDMGVVRTVDINGKVQTLAGQARNYGIGANPISARYSKIAFFDINGDDVYVNNKLENQIVKFSLAGSLLEHVAGNGISGFPAHDSFATSSPLANCSWSMPCGFQIDNINNRLYSHGSSGKLSYINLITGKWFIENYTVQSDGRISFLGQNADGLVAYIPSHYGASGSHVTVRSINQNTLASTILYGKDQALLGNSTSLCSGSVGTDCTLAETLGEDVQTQMKYDTNLNSWFLAYKASKQINAIPSSGGTVTQYTTTVNNFDSFEFQRVVGNEYVFYCGTNGNLYKRNVISATETQLALPTSSMKCAGQALQYHSGRDSLIFIYLQNGLYGIAEFKNP